MLTESEEGSEESKESSEAESKGEQQGCSEEENKNIKLEKEELHSTEAR